MRDERDGSEMDDMIGLHSLHDSAERGQVSDVGLVQICGAADRSFRSMDDSMNFVAEASQGVHDITASETRRARDQCPGHIRS
jgi:hypothetical protein